MIFSARLGLRELVKRTFQVKLEPTHFHHAGRRMMLVRERMSTRANIRQRRMQFCIMAPKKLIHQSSDARRKCAAKAKIGVDKIPEFCPRNAHYRVPNGYRKVVGNSCTGGQESKYMPIVKRCPSWGSSFSGSLKVVGLLLLLCSIFLLWR